MTDSDINIAKAIKNSDIKVFEKLFRSLYPALCGYALKILKDPDQAEEIVQDVFYTFWKKRESLIINVSIKSYLYKSVYNKCMHYFEHQNVVNNYAQSAVYHNSAYYNPEEGLHTGEIYALYRKTLNQLPERCREIFQLSRKYGLKYNEIAEKLSISIKTVEANMGKALKAFKNSLAEYQTID